MKVAVVGVTGLVGSVILKVLEELKFPIRTLIPVASARSAGKHVLFRKQSYEVVGLREALSAAPDMAIFSAGSSISKEWGPVFGKNGCYVIDNSSAWRKSEEVPLVIPEINGHIIEKHHKLIANPNCSTIQMLMVLAPLHKNYVLKKIVAATYQSVSGTGVNAVQQLMAERKKEACEKAYPYPIDLNCLPHGGDFMENDYTAEEMKLVNETHKILEAPAIDINATVVRVPVMGGHSEAIYAEFEKNVDTAAVKDILSKSRGVIVRDEPEKNIYPMPLYVQDRNEVFVGRIRKGLFSDNSLNMWIVADNLRKGAATNAVQIAQLIKDSFL